MAMAYRNTKFTLKHKIAVKREDAVTREMTKSNQILASGFFSVPFICVFTHVNSDLNVK